MYLVCTYLEGQLSQTKIIINLSYHQQKQVFKSYVNKLSKLMRVALNVYSW